MIRALFLSAAVLTACAATEAAPGGNEMPEGAAESGAIGPQETLEKGTKAPPPIAAPVASAPLPPRVAMIDGRIAQGGLSFWVSEPGSEVFLDGKSLPVDDEGNFALGFGVKEEGARELLVVLPGGNQLSRTLTIADRTFPLSEVGNLPPSKVTPRTEEQLAKIAADRDLKNAARRAWTDEDHWKTGWRWPIYGRISTRMGADRTLNGVEQNRPHSGIDIARYRGTSWEAFHGSDVVAPADGLVTLANPDLYFEGGTVFIDHGLRIESVMLHLSRVDVQPGQIVKKGDVIGGVGMTGRANGPHLHWTINWNGTQVDPLLLMSPMPPKPE